MVGKDLIMATLFGSGGGSGGGIPQEDIDAAFAALAEKGVTVPDGATSADLDDLITSIVTGGGAKIKRGTITPTENGVVTINHDLGTVPDFIVVTAATITKTAHVITSFIVLRGMRKSLSQIDGSAILVYSTSFNSLSLYSGKAFGTGSTNMNSYIKGLTENTITVGANSASASGIFGAGVVYSWMVGVPE